MNTVAAAALRPPEHAPPATGPAEAGSLGRLGRYTATHFGTVLSAWLVIALALGFFAPRV